MSDKPDEPIERLLHELAEGLAKLPSEEQRRVLAEGARMLEKRRMAERKGE